MTVKALAEMAVVAFLVLGFGHYGMPRVMGREPRRLEAYITGILFGIWIPVALVTWWEGLPWSHFFVVMVASVGAGAGTALAWALDKIGGAGGLTAWLGSLKEGARNDCARENAAHPRNRPV